VKRISMNHLFKFCLATLICLSITFTVNASREELEELRDAVNFVIDTDDINAMQIDHTKTDQDALLVASDTIKKSLNNYDFEEESLIYISYWYLKSVYLLNEAREETESGTDTAQLIEVLQHIDTLLEKFDGQNKSSYFDSMMFKAGQIANNSLGDARLANKYWHICAEYGHAGCMNILAYDYFIGNGEVAQDLNQSLYWHNKTFETGIKFRCAGTYSAYTIQETLFFFPALSTTSNWRDWGQKIRSLNEEQLAFQNDGEKDWCDKSEFYLNEYIFELFEGNTAEHIIKNAFSLMDMKVDIDKQEIAALKKIGSKSFIDESLGLLGSIEKKSSKCNVAWFYTFYAKAINEDAHAEKVLDAVSDETRTECDSIRATVALLQNDGRW
jgi:hypothetical protein